MFSVTLATCWLERPAFWAGKQPLNPASITKSRAETIKNFAFTFIFHYLHRLIDCPRQAAGFLSIALPVCSILLPILPARRPPVLHLPGSAGSALPGLFAGCFRTLPVR